MSNCYELVVCSYTRIYRVILYSHCIVYIKSLYLLPFLYIKKVSKGDSKLKNSLKLSFMLVRLAIRYFYHSLPNHLNARQTGSSSKGSSKLLRSPLRVVRYSNGNSSIKNHSLLDRVPVALVIKNK